MSFANHPEIEFLRRKGWHRALAAAFDLVSILVAWYATLEFRLLLNPVMRSNMSRDVILRHAPPVTEMLLVWIVVAIWLGLYRIEHGPRLGGRLRKVMNAVVLSSAVLTAYGFLARQIGADDISRAFVLLFAPVSLLSLLAANYAVLIASIFIGRRFRFEERVAVAGDGPDAQHLADQLTRYGGSARVIGFIRPKAAVESAFRSRTPVLGTTATIAEVINRAKLDRIIVANGSLPREEVAACTRIARRMGVATGHALAGVLEQDLSHASLHVGHGLAIVELRAKRFEAKQEIVKRALDVCCSAVLFILALPALVVLAALVKLTSPGPILYLSDRVGRGGRHFTFYKFRTMFQGADALRERCGVNESDGHLFKIRHDPRITPIGRFMRRYSLDELPQLVNVLLGDMSLVGPRPLPAADLDPDGCSKAFAIWAHERAEVLPGITCLWQIRGRSDLPFDKMIDLDLEYIRNWSMALDLEILLETPLAVLSGRGAY
jgi:exopolysaccharide biosynthesis polyprenyl glycosylphosphotransferase